MSDSEDDHDLETTKRTKNEQEEPGSLVKMEEETTHNLKCGPTSPPHMAYGSNGEMIDLDLKTAITSMKNTEDSINKDETLTCPRKRHFRQHAHANPYKETDMYIPCSFDTLDPVADFVDIGCGYGTFLMKISRMFPDKIIYGLEIREKVAEYVKLRIEWFKKNNRKPDGVDSDRASLSLKRNDIGNTSLNKHDHVVTTNSPEKYDHDPTIFQNIRVFKTNAMLFFPHFFDKSSLEKIFILFPDPHFKKKKHRVRMVTRATIPFFHYSLKDEGRIYLSTDVKDLYYQMLEDLTPFFKKISEEDSSNDPLYEMIGKETDESKRAGARVSHVYRAIFIKK